MGSDRFVSALFAGEPLGPGLFVSERKLANGTCAVALLSWRAELNGFLRGLVNFLWCDQYRHSRFNGCGGVGGHDSADASTLLGRSTMTTKSVVAKGIVEGFESPTQSFDRLLRRLAAFRPALF